MDVTDNQNPIQRRVLRENVEYVHPIKRVFPIFPVNFVVPQILSSESLSDGSVFIRWADLDLGWRTPSRMVKSLKTGAVVE